MHWIFFSCISFFFSQGNTGLSIRDVFLVERRGSLGWTVADSGPLSRDKAGKYEAEIIDKNIIFYACIEQVFSYYAFSIYML